MDIEWVPLLQRQQDLYSLDQSWKRFRAYLKTMLSADASVAELFPMASINPMGKAHVVESLDALIAMDAEVLAAYPKR